MTLNFYNITLLCIYLSMRFYSQYNVLVKWGFTVQTTHFWLIRYCIYTTCAYTRLWYRYGFLFLITYSSFSISIICLYLCYHYLHSYIALFTLAVEEVFFLECTQTDKQFHRSVIISVSHYTRHTKSNTHMKLIVHFPC